MASSSSCNNIPLSTLLEWYRIRDCFYGHNKAPQNVPFAIELASSCQHPDALWLTKACAGKDVRTMGEANQVFSALGQNDARALCFTWCCSYEDEMEDLAPLRRSAELGFAFAQGLLAEQTHGDERFKFALLAALQGERDGFLLLGCCFRDGEGCEKDLDKAKENFLRASKLGFVWAMDQLGKLLDASDPQRWYWLGHAAARGNNWNFVSLFSKQVELFNSGSGSAVVMFAIGRALQGHVSEESRTIFKERHKFVSLIGPAKQAIAFYEAQIKASKDAMRAWTQIGVKLKVVKDVRKLIAKLIWDSREEALYKT
jgi:TPR repeat protein